MLGSVPPKRAVLDRGRKEELMRRLMIAGVAAALIAGPFAGSALAQEDPPLNERVRDVLCTVVEKLGFVYVEWCE
jgi:hypothetical protein